MARFGILVTSDAPGSTESLASVNLSFAPGTNPCASDTFGQVSGVFVCPAKLNKEGYDDGSPPTE